MRAIHCPKCGQGETFTVISDVRVSTEVDCYGEALGSTDFANMLYGQGLVCPDCGHSWRTKRHFAIDVDVR